MRTLFNAFKVHNTRYEDRYPKSVRAIPEPVRLTINDAISYRRGLNLRRAAPKTIPPLTYTPPTTNKKKDHVKKNELQHSFPSNRLPESLLPVNSFSLTDLQKFLTSLPVKSRDEMMEFYFRFLPEHTRFLRYEFWISNEVKKMLKYVFTSLGLKKMVRFSCKDLFLNTRIRGGIHHLLEGTDSPSSPFQRVMEFITYYKGSYGRLIVFISLGVGCTVWYTFLPGAIESVPPEILVPRALPYDYFKNVDYHLAHFKKMSFVEYKYITDQVLSALENVYPFSEINLPSINPDEASNVSTSDARNNASNAKVALGLGIIVAVYLAMGMVSYEPPELITTSQAPELMATSFLFPLRRSYSTINSSQVQLSEDIDFLYHNLKVTINYNMSQKELCNLQQLLLSGFYTLSPLRFMRIRRDDLGYFLQKTLPDFPDLTFYPSRDSSYYNVVLPSKKEDVLVFMALSINLYRFTYGSVPKENYRLSDRVGLFYSSIQDMGKVTRLYRINMDPYLQQIDDRLVLDGVKSFVGADSVCYKLVSSFINLETIDEDGRKIRFDSIPIVGEITRVLFNLALMEFDRRLCQKYPGIAFERFIGLVFIACTADLRIDESQVRDMIQDIGLSSEIDYTEPGGEPLECRQRRVALDHDGKVVVYTPTE